MKVAVLAAAVVGVFAAGDEAKYGENCVSPLVFESIFVGGGSWETPCTEEMPIPEAHDYCLLMEKNGYGGPNCVSPSWGDKKTYVEWTAGSQHENYKEEHIGGEL